MPETAVNQSPATCMHAKCPPHRHSPAYGLHVPPGYRVSGGWFPPLVGLPFRACVPHCWAFPTSTMRGTYRLPSTISTKPQARLTGESFLSQSTLRFVRKPRFHTCSKENTLKFTHVQFLINVSLVLCYASERVYNAVLFKYPGKD